MRRIAAYKLFSHHPSDSCVYVHLQHPEHQLFGDNQHDAYMLFPNGKEFELWFYALQRASALSTNVRTPRSWRVFNGLHGTRLTSRPHGYPTVGQVSTRGRQDQLLLFPVPQHPDEPRYGVAWSHSTIDGVGPKRLNDHIVGLRKQTRRMTEPGVTPSWPAFGGMCHSHAWLMCFFAMRQAWPGVLSHLFLLLGISKAAKDSTASSARASVSASPK